MTRPATSTQSSRSAQWRRSWSSTSSRSVLPDVRIREGSIVGDGSELRHPLALFRRKIGDPTLSIILLKVIKKTKNLPKIAENQASFFNPLYQFPEFGRATQFLLREKETGNYLCCRRWAKTWRGVFAVRQTVCRIGVRHWCTTKGHQCRTSCRTSKTPLKTNSVLPDYFLEIPQKISINSPITT
jgi:hypothetical protein